jgi:hypothetical protein
MDWRNIYSNEALQEKAEKLFKEQRDLKRLDGWFLIKEIQMRYEQELSLFEPEMQAAQMLKKITAELPLTISEHAVFAGTQNDAFARTYALINPAFYLYVNVTTPDMLRKIKENPQKYAPSGVYIMRIHGTFVNFLDLSPAIQNDIILRLDLQSTKM